MSGRSGSGDIYVMNADGLNETVVPMASGSEENSPDYSPNGTKIIYHANSDGRLYTMNADGSARTPLTPVAGVPVFSPDGTRIAYAQDTGDIFFYDEIFTAAVDGSGPLNITNNGPTVRDEDPAWAVKYTKSVPVPPDTTAPETTQGKGPKKKIQKRTATFHFTSEAGATFRCVLDDKPDVACTDPFTAKKLKKGKHVVLAVAVDAAGNTDATPARWKFKVTK